MNKSIFHFKIIRIQDSKREERKKLADEEALRKIKQLEEQKYELQKQIANQKPVDGLWPGQFGGRPFGGSHVSRNQIIQSEKKYWLEMFPITRFFFFI